MKSPFPPFRNLLPAEHGTWFMLGFPLVLGLLLRPSGAGACLAGAAACAFLARPPLRRVLGGHGDPRQRRVLGLLGGGALTFAATTLWLSDARFLIPLVALSPLLLLALRADRDRAVRALWVELAAQTAFAALVPALMIAGGASLSDGLRAGALAALIGGANLAHVRRWLGQAHGLASTELSRRWASSHLLHGLLTMVSVLLCAGRGLPGWVWMGWTAVLWARALMPYHPLPAKTLGWREGGLSVVGLALLAWALT